MQTVWFRKQPVETRKIKTGAGESISDPREILFTNPILLIVKGKRSNFYAMKIIRSEKIAGLLE